MLRITLILLIVNLADLIASDGDFLSAKPRKGHGIYQFFEYYNIPYNKSLTDRFLSDNKGKFGPKHSLMLHHDYLLPIKVYKFDGSTIRSTIGITDYDQAKAIEQYNKSLQKSRAKSSLYTEDLVLWVPDFTVSKGTSSKKNNGLQNFDIALFGSSFRKFSQTDFKLNDYIVYLVAGHGGPDPGAIGHKAGHDLCEDEYAYDVVLRTARNLMQHGAETYVIIRDPDDGIRQGAYLECDNDETNYSGDTISHDQVIRLTQRVDDINELYNKNRHKRKKQLLIVVHVDSRSMGKRLDIFFYHNQGSRTGKRLAETLHETIGDKYARAQPGRGYQGTIKTRGLFMLRKTTPPCVFIELGNIRNPEDQNRFLIEDNRQAIANWLSAGVLRYAK